MQIEVIETKTSKIWKREDGIIYQEMKQDSYEILETAKENNDAIESLINEKCLLLANASAIKYMDREARAYYSSSGQSKRIYKAVAVVSDMKIGKVIGNFILKINKTSFPFKIFNNEDEATSWLKKIS